MVKLYPDNTLEQLEFDKIIALLSEACRTVYARTKTQAIRLHTKKAWIDQALDETAEYLSLLNSHQPFPNHFTSDVSKELKLLKIQGATLTEEQFRNILSLSENTAALKRWFSKDRANEYKALHAIQKDTEYTEAVESLIKEVIDESGQVRDQASDNLASIRQSIYSKRNEIRKVFSGISSRYAKLGYLADIEESFMNGRRVLAVVAEYKRMVQGVLHGESDSRRTAFIEPEETTVLNNELFSLAWDERAEVQRVLHKLTQSISRYALQLDAWLTLNGEFDFIQAKAAIARLYGGTRPMIAEKAMVKLIDAKHPLLYLKNTAAQKPVIPLSVTLNDKDRILIISGPNAGGKTVTLRTIGLLQLMVQSGLMVPVHPDSEMGVFKQLFIHIGDMQSIEFELSTYSAQLKNMKHFVEQANGKTLFFIDELGSGSDPVLGGAFAEVFLEALTHKHAMGVVTTHYLNLKIMANHVKGIVNAAMQFNEKALKPLYRLQIGQPGSSYTFSIAERIGIDNALIQRARKLVEKNHVRLDTLLNKTEQEFQQVQGTQKKLNQLLKENTQLKAEMEKVISKESHKQEIEKLRHQNKISEERIAFLKDMERKLKVMVIEWRKTEDKSKVVKMIQALLFGQKEKLVKGKKEKELIARFEELDTPLMEGALVKLKSSRMVGTLRAMKGKKAVVQVGNMPVTVDKNELVVVQDKLKQTT
jgi:DNA mismatch repair protein MutS2